MKRIAWFFLLVFCLPAKAADFTFITEKGYVTFSVGDNWRVLGMQPKPPISSAIFQIENAADNGTPDSTNLAITLYDPNSPKAKDASAKIGRQFGEKPATIETKGDWTIYRQEALQNDTVYSILDARREIADVVVGVRLAWPHLPNNSPSHGIDMEGTFDLVRQAIRGTIGTYTSKENDQIFRPNQ